MKTLLAIGLTILCWGLYGPVLHLGQAAMQQTRLRPFIGVGLAYFLIAVVVPWLYLRWWGESGHWTIWGMFWSLAAGAAGAVGALGIIFAFANHGRPVFVMPLVFGGAPVVNAFWTIFMARSMKKVSATFLAGLIIVVTGAMTVLAFKPGAGSAQIETMNFRDLVQVLISVLVVVLCWGAYGPILHKGQVQMQGSRLRPLICVGLAYFAIAVLVPAVLLTSQETDASFTFSGMLFSLAAGALGAIGALGIVMAFNSGGKPVYVMPLVFGGAPVVNTITSLMIKSSVEPDPIFYAGLILVAAGAVVVLVFAPRGGPPMPSADTVVVPTQTVAMDKPAK